MHIVVRPYLASRIAISRCAVATNRAPDIPERMPEGNGAAVRVDVLGVVGEAEEPEHGESLRGERFIELYDLDIGQAYTRSIQQLLGRRHRADSHDARRDAGDGHRHDASRRF